MNVPMSERALRRRHESGYGRQLLTIATLTLALLIPAMPVYGQGLPNPAPLNSENDGSTETDPFVGDDSASPIVPNMSPSSVSDGLSDEIGELGSFMGQGLARLKETGDVKVPTLREQALEELVNDVGLEKAAEIDLTSTRGNAAMASSWRPPGVQGMDVSSHQLNVDWRAAYNQGSRFAYVKATEGTGYKNPYFNQQYGGSAAVGMLRGAYHFALPGLTSGTAQANYFVDNGGGWSADGATMPPLLDVEYNPYPSLGNDCYNMSPTRMVSWIREFSNTMISRTGRAPMIYTTTDWWNRCTGNSRAFSDHPLHIASYSQAGPGTMPSSWSVHSVWQYSDRGPFVGDSNVWNGTAEQLARFARNSGVAAEQPTARLNELHYRGASPSSTGLGLSTDTVLSCDWNGDGISTPATFYGGIWTIKNTLAANDSGFRISFGAAGDQPICGDWNGNGVDTIGVYRDGVAHVRNSNSSGFADGTIVFGARGDTAIVGDWNGDGYDTLGVARASGAAKQFYLTNSNLRPTVSGSFLFGNASDTPISGDWNNSGYTTVGVKRGAQWYLSNSNLRVRADLSFAYGNHQDSAITGRWAAGRGTSVGVVRVR